MWFSLFRKRNRCIMVMYFRRNEGYAMAVTVNPVGNITVNWTERVQDEADNIMDSLQGKMLYHDIGYHETIICVDDEQISCIEKIYPPLTDRELLNAIKMEAEYTADRDAMWCYEKIGDTTKIRILDWEKLKGIVQSISGTGIISGIVALPQLGKLEQVEVDWGEMEEEIVTQDRPWKRLLQAIWCYLDGRYCTFGKISSWLYKWNWLGAGIVFFCLNFLIAMVIAIGGMLYHQSYQDQITDKNNQLLLMENTENIKETTGSAQREIKMRANIMASLRDRGMGFSSYGFLVELSSISSDGVVLTEVSATADKQIILKGRAKDMTSLLRYSEHIGDFGGLLKEALVIKDSKWDENGDVEFTCQGKL